MQTRITLSRNQDGSLEIWVNEAGRDALVKHLQRLSTEADHFHLGPSAEDADVSLTTTAYRPEDEVIHWGKVMFRPDEWDAEHYPHVMP